MIRTFPPQLSNDDSFLSEPKPTMKDCDECSGRGHDDFDDECVVCEGTGWFEMDTDEIREAIESKKENKSEL